MPPFFESCDMRSSIWRSTPGARFFDRALDREPEREDIGRAVALDDDAAQTDERRAIVAAMIDAALECADDRVRDEPRAS